MSLRCQAHLYHLHSPVFWRVQPFFALVLLLVFSHAANAKSELELSTYTDFVDQQGNISLPENFHTQWVFIGTWSVAQKDVEVSGAASGHGAAGLHNVYTQPGVVEYYLENKTFPDGAVLIKELLTGVTQSMTTGTVSRAGELEGWFVMIKDTQNRFSDNPLWGDGWGWALFNSNDRVQTVTKNYKSECIGCHIPAKNTDWIYIDGYPILQSD